MPTRRGVALNADGLKILESHIASLGLPIASNGKVSHAKLSRYFSGNGWGDWQAIRKVRVGEKSLEIVVQTLCELLHFDDWRNYLDNHDSTKSTESSSDHTPLFKYLKVIASHTLSPKGP